MNMRTTEQCENGYEGAENNGTSLTAWSTSLVRVERGSCLRDHLDWLSMVELQDLSILLFELHAEHEKVLL